MKRLDQQPPQSTPTPEYKTCTRCGEAKSVTTFGQYRGRGKLRRESKCRHCRAKYLREWKASNPEKVLQYRINERPARKRYYWANRERLLTLDALRDRREYTARNKERRRAYSATWFQENREITYRNKHRYYARKAGRLSDLTIEQWRFIKAAWRFRCAYCGKKPSTLAQDHVIPLSLGGDDTATNLAPSCQRCNSSKGASTPTFVQLTLPLPSPV
ncbi:hypothetical protein LCGC14_2379430 [marine sediment metagenome]|uniref:HNH nuclease domain-containing protein n=1 Tax=marine sediment metagenome TaxID=412755 RepID=A0A0F9C1G9_9ZZZZ